MSRHSPISLSPFQPGRPMRWRFTPSRQPPYRHPSCQTFGQASSVRRNFFLLHSVSCRKTSRREACSLPSCWPAGASGPIAASSSSNGKCGSACRRRWPRLCWPPTAPWCRLPAAAEIVDGRDGGDFGHFVFPRPPRQYLSRRPSVTPASRMGKGASHKIWEL